MIFTSNKITSLSDDIRKIFVKIYGENTEMIRLCRDHHDPLLLHDKKPVFSITQDEFVGIFDSNYNHYFLSPGQAVRLSIYCSLAMPRVIALMLKAEWEHFIAEISCHCSVSGLNLGSILSDQNLIKLYIADFKPNKWIIYDLIRNNSDNTNAGITYGQVDFFVSDLLDRNIFLIDNELTGQMYPQTEITEELLLKKITVQQREEYIRSKELWKVKSTAFDDMLLYLERKKRVNMAIENKYFRFFGNLEAEKSKFVCRLEKYKAILNIMRDQPELSYRESIKKAERNLIETERERAELKNKITRSRNYIENIVCGGTLSTVSDEFRSSYALECKILLKKLFLLLHTDTCPNYYELSREEKTEINELWLELMKSTKEEMFSYSPSMLLYSLPDYDQLQSIYKRTCDILGINPDSYKPANRLEFMIRNGASTEAILEFLKNETEQIELHLAHLELVQDEYTNEDQTQIYNTALENINTHTEKLKNEIAELKKQIIELKKEITSQHINAVKQ